MHSALPASVQITDVTARDGFQNIAATIPTALKEQVLDELAASGIARLEATSFVSPKAVPQMADAAEIVEYARTKHPTLSLMALAPNMRGAKDAFAAGIREINYVISVSAAHNKANINRTHEESLNDLETITRTFPELRVNVSLATVFGCPFEGAVPVEKTIRLLRAAMLRGASSATLCDTIGVANPLQIQAVLEEIRSNFSSFSLGLHLHDTHGMGLANSLAALQMGLDRFETATGGLGGCPFAPGAAGNTATEDMVNMLQRMGIKTGIELEKLLQAVRTIKSRINPNIPGRLSSSRTYAEFCFFG